MYSLLWLFSLPYGHHYWHRFTSPSEGIANTEPSTTGECLLAVPTRMVTVLPCLQNYAVLESNLPMAPVAQAIPPQHMTQQQSLPSSSLVQSPMPIPQHGTGTQIIYGTPGAIQTAQPLTQVQPGVYTLASAAPPGLNVTSNLVTLNSPSLRTPMSRLGYQLADSTQFPDPTKLEPVPSSQVNMELFARGLAEPWNHYNNQVQQQVCCCTILSLSLSLSLSLPLPPHLPLCHLVSLPYEYLWCTHTTRAAFTNMLINAISTADWVVSTWVTPAQNDGDHISIQQVGQELVKTWNQPDFSNF